MTTAAAPTSSLTRADLLTLGRSASPWNFIPLAYLGLKAAPQDLELRFLLAAAYTKIGLRTPAVEHLAIIQQALLDHAAVQSLVQVAEQLIADTICTEALKKVAMANLEATAGPARDCLKEVVASWASALASRQHFRTTSGDIVWRTSAGWSRLLPSREAIAKLDVAKVIGPATAMAPTCTIEGLDPPWALLRLHRELAPTSLGYQPMLQVVQASPEQALDGLMSADLRQVLSDPRVRLFIGPSAGSQLASHVERRTWAGVDACGPVLRMPTCDPLVEPTPDAIQASALRAMSETTSKLVTINHARAAALPEDHFARRLAQARSGGQPLRVLLITSRYTTFIQYAMADLARALGNANCEVRTLIEPDAHSVMSPLAYSQEIHDHPPELVILSNYLRAHLKSHLPPQIPFAMWLQDGMPHLMSETAGKSIGPRDMIFGNVPDLMFVRHRYPRWSALRHVTPANVAKFNTRPIDPVLRQRLTCDLAYVSHHGPSPAELHAQLASTSSDARVFEALFPLVLREAETALGSGPITPRLIGLTRDLLEREFPDQLPSLQAIVHSYVLPIADRHFRHQTLTWASELAAQHGWKLHIYGCGWDAHPTLARYAKGELAHGDALRAAYASASAHLQVSMHTVMHQRVFECALSGGFPLCRLQSDDLSFLQYRAAAETARAYALNRQPPDAVDEQTPPDHGYRWHGFSALGSDAGRAYSQMRNRLDIPLSGNPPMLWLHGAHVERISSNPEAPIDGSEFDFCTLLGDPAAHLFHSRSQLESRINALLSDSEARAARIADLAARARAHATHDSLATKVLAHMQQQLEAELLKRETQPAQFPHEARGITIQTQRSVASRELAV